MQGIYRFIFDEPVPAKEIEEALFWSRLNAESIFGKAKVRLDASYSFDPEKKTCEIDKTTEVGQHIAQIFITCITRSFGDKAFTVERLRKKKKFIDQENG